MWENLKCHHCVLQIIYKTFFRSKMTIRENDTLTHAHTHTRTQTHTHTPDTSD